MEYLIFDSLIVLSIFYCTYILYSITIHDKRIEDGFTYHSVTVEGFKLNWSDVALMFIKFIATTWKVVRFFL